jgi:hypothetical protein
MDQSLRAWLSRRDETLRISLELSGQEGLAIYHKAGLIWHEVVVHET